MADTRQYIDNQFIDDLARAQIMKKKESLDGFRRGFGAAATGWGAGAATGAALFKKDEQMPIQLLSEEGQLRLLNMLLDEDKDKAITDAKTKVELAKIYKDSIDSDLELVKALAAARSGVDVAKINGAVDAFNTRMEKQLAGADKANAPTKLPEGPVNSIIANMKLDDVTHIQALLAQMELHPPESGVQQAILKAVVEQHPIIMADGQSRKLESPDDLLRYWATGGSDYSPDGRPTTRFDPELVGKIAYRYRTSQAETKDTTFNDEALAAQFAAELKAELDSIGGIDPTLVETIARKQEKLWDLASGGDEPATDEDKAKVKAARDGSVALATGATPEEIEDAELTPEELKYKFFQMIQEDSVVLPDTYQRRFDAIMQSPAVQEYAAKNNIPPERIEGMVYEAAKNALKYQKLEGKAGKLGVRQSLRDTQGKEVVANRLDKRIEKVEDKAKPIGETFRFAKEPTPAARTRPPTEERKRQMLMTDFAKMGTSPNPTTTPEAPTTRTIDMERLMENTSMIEDPMETERKRKLGTARLGVKSYDKKVDK